MSSPTTTLVVAAAPKPLRIGIRSRQSDPGSRHGRTGTSFGCQPPEQTNTARLISQQGNNGIQLAIIHRKLEHGTLGRMDYGTGREDDGKSARVCAYTGTQVSVLHACLPDPEFLIASSIGTIRSCRRSTQPCNARCSETTSPRFLPA